MSAVLDKLKDWLRGAEDVAEGEIPVATPRHDADRETSANAQTEGAVGQPWHGGD
jgi:hypothetical protein